jgi:hypothetical protein
LYTVEGAVHIFACRGEGGGKGEKKMRKRERRKGQGRSATPPPSMFFLWLFAIVFYPVYYKWLDPYIQKEKKNNALS